MIDICFDRASIDIGQMFDRCSIGDTSESVPGLRRRENMRREEKRREGKGREDKRREGKGREWKRREEKMFDMRCSFVF